MPGGIASWPSMASLLTTLASSPLTRPWPTTLRPASKPIPRPRPSATGSPVSCSVYSRKRRQVSKSSGSPLPLWPSCSPSLRKAPSTRTQPKRSWARCSRPAGRRRRLWPKRAWLRSATLTSWSESLMRLSPPTLTRWPSIGPARSASWAGSSAR